MSTVHIIAIIEEQEIKVQQYILARSREEALDMLRQAYIKDFAYDEDEFDASTADEEGLVEAFGLQGFALDFETKEF